MFAKYKITVFFLFCMIYRHKTQNSELRILFNITMKIYKYNQ